MSSDAALCCPLFALTCVCIFGCFTHISVFSVFCRKSLPNQRETLKIVGRITLAELWLLMLSSCVHLAEVHRFICLSVCRTRLELMRQIYNEDLSPQSPEPRDPETGALFPCFPACSSAPNQKYFNFCNLVPSR